MDNIKLFKLLTGEEVIARVDNENEDGTITVNKPRVVMIVPGPNGQMGVSLIPLFACNQDGTADLERAAIAATSCEVNAEMIKSYISHTTGLALA